MTFRRKSKLIAAALYTIIGVSAYYADDWWVVFVMFLVKTGGYAEGLISSEDN